MQQLMTDSKTSVSPSILIQIKNAESAVSAFRFIVSKVARACDFRPVRFLSAVKFN